MAKSKTKSDAILTNKAPENEVIDDLFIEQKCRERLMSVGYDFDEQKKMYRNRLLEIERFAQNNLMAKKRLIQESKDMNLNKTQIAKALNITRQTLYNDEITELFVNAIINEVSNEDPGAASKRSLLNRIKELEEDLKELQNKEIIALDKKIKDENVVNYYAKIR